MTKKNFCLIPALWMLLIGIPLLIIFIPSHRPTKTVRISGQMSLRQIADKLEEKQLLRSRPLFMLLTRFSGKEKRLQAGLYEFPLRSSPFEILRKLIAGETAVIRITIPEGWSSREIAEELEYKELCPGRSFLDVVREKQLEGFLFPETYFIPSDFSAEAIANTFVKGFESRWLPEWNGQAKRLRLSQREIVILASIIEREAQADVEKTLISSVFHNRLRKKMRLEADPTILYALGSWNRTLTRLRMHTASPYNTYLHRGLPPGPICNPGSASLQAALYPENTPYLFFVSNRDGTHTFSQTVAEHNAAIRAIRERMQALELESTEPETPVQWKVSGP